jgi:demethylmenaquinone methyltransferase / 2-methoxy-6-polyprenyl-1,4-benzoquinol methylase
MSPQKATVQQMFDEISPKYDFLNHVLSLGIDFHWRKKLVALLSKKHALRILDVATGTGDVAIALSRLNPEKIVGIDISERMLEIARRKVSEKDLEKIISFRQSDAERIPFSDGSFDAVTVAFGVRNFEDLPKGLSEMKRVLRPGGTMMILEFSHPTTTPFKQLYHFYSRFVIPFIGKLISDHAHAYTYLPQSVAAFPSGDDFLNILRGLELTNCHQQTLSSGIASIYSCQKPDKIKRTGQRY